MSRQYFAIVPAAGSGSRFGAPRPKQYLTLNGVPLIRHTIAALLADARIARVVVVLSPDDTDWSAACLPESAAKRVVMVPQGGTSRAESVLNGIRWLQSQPDVKPDDWVLVHDAARPCLAPAQLDHLINTLRNDAVGGLLAIPVADTMKRASTGDRVDETVDRRQLWQAQTPQMFPLQRLIEALHAVDPAIATDESSAIEALGLQPRLVAGSLSNLKVTYPQDLILASAILGAASTFSEGE
jgi:2-C-methyl-D-erythritol 4-phosphate cytidylyltransferase